MNTHAHRSTRRSMNLPLHLAALAIGLFAPIASVSAQCLVSFAAAANYNTLRPFANDMAGGDFNGDGRLDLVVQHGSTAFCTVELGNADGTFTYGGIVDAGGTSIKVGDLNADGRLDIVMTGDARFVVVLGNGDGTFGEPIVDHFGTWTIPNSVAIGDLNGDGRPDLVLPNNQTHEVVVMEGVGDGTFVPFYWGLMAGDPLAVEVGDFNGDGRLDIAATTTLNTVAVLLGLNGINFFQPVYYNVGTNPRALAVGDLNSDGRLDLVTTNSGSISVLLGSGNGAFAPAVSYGASALAAVSIGDLNSDGRPDLAVGAGGALVLKGNGDGTFAGSTSFPTGQTTVGIVAGDFNGDGRRDLAMAGLGNTFDNLKVLLNNAYTQAPVFTQHPTSQTVVYQGSVSFTTGVNFFQTAPNYRRRRNGTYLFDFGAFSGTGTSTLTINSAMPSYAGTYDVEVRSTGCNGEEIVVISDPAVLTVTMPPGPANDACSAALRIGGGSTPFTTLGAVTDGPAEAHLGFCCDDTQVNGDIWFIYTATCSGSLTIGLCGSNFDTKVAVYNGTTCPSGPNTAIAGNDDSNTCGPNSRESQVTFNAVAGREYLIRVGAFQADFGTGTLTISCDGGACLAADLGVQGGGPGRDGTLDNNDFVAFINAFFSHTGCP